ncbi:MFS transporter [Solirubrobacter sp. CPCC 204708]|uniref:MFS transporter n=1 Tax=Solirubrobacter deserti TaxID=2282478 RepID=A0ABT4RU58_9ACTN|nr:MFS transporter [Solirubrobacter deserti]MBE2317255.1 MFS transporter [Solirubrobacter deserti]MDA0142022.1 MFS transporter [Solirubrobacter deserti]
MTTAWRMWALAAAFYLVAIFHRMSLGVASLDAAERFGVAAGTIALLSTVQLGFYLAMQIPAGLLADRIGPRRSLTLGLVAMGVGELLFAVSPSIGPAIAGRALVGIGDACMFLNVLRVAAHWLPPRRYALAAALTAACGAFGQLLSTAPLSAALSGLGWTPTFAASGVLTAALAYLAVSRIQDRPRDPEPAPVPTTLAERIRTVAPEHPPIVPALRKAWRSPATRHGLWVHFALNAPFVTLTGLWAYPYLVEGQGVAPGTAAAMLAAAVITFGVSAPVLGAVAGRIPHAVPTLAAAIAVTTAAGLATMLGWPGGHPPLALIAAVLALSGFAGAGSMLAFTLAREGGGSASGMVNIGGFGAAIVGQAAIGLLVSVHLDYRLALTPLLALVVWGAVQTVRHASLPLPWSSSKA